MIWWAAFLIGLTGSLHCAGMCSPIALTIPITPKYKITSFVALTFYNLGRTTTYITIGLLVGFFAQGLDLTGLQNYFSILTGISLIFIFLFSLNVESWIGKLPFYRKVHKLIGRVMRFAAKNHPIDKPSFGSSYLVGLTNGLLPCGLVYMAIAGALTTAGPMDGMIFMAFFGLGTFPMLTFIPVFMKTAGKKFQIQARKYIPILLLVMAMLFIFRGLEMGGMWSPIIDPADPDASCLPNNNE